MTVNELLEVAKELGVVGRHKMTKAQLEEKISEINKRSAHEKEIENDVVEVKAPKQESGHVISSVSEWEKETIRSAETSIFLAPRKAKPKKLYIDNLEKGSLIAFKVSDTKMLSGKVVEISHNVTVETRTGVRFSITRDKIAWVKTSDRWPRGVYLALKGVAGVDEYKKRD